MAKAFKLADYRAVAEPLRQQVEGFKARDFLLTDVALARQLKRNKLNPVQVAAALAHFEPITRVPGKPQEHRAALAMKQGGHKPIEIAAGLGAIQENATSVVAAIADTHRFTPPQKATLPQLAQASGRHYTRLIKSVALGLRATGRSHEQIQEALVKGFGAIRTRSPLGFAGAHVPKMEISHPGGQSETAAEVARVLGQLHFNKTSPQPAPVQPRPAQRRSWFRFVRGFRRT